MGYEDENVEPCVLDLETAARDGIDELLDVPSAPANYKDPAKILDAKLEKLKTLIERAALDINLNRIVAFGVWTPSQGVRVVIAKNEDEERGHLAALGLFIRNSGHRRRIVNFNGLSFDLMVCVRRAQLLGVTDFPALDITPAWRSPHTDLMEVLTFGGKVAKHSLDFYCRVFGIDAEELDDVKLVSGADIPRLVKEERWDLIEGHCRYDVTLTMLLAKRLRVINEA